MCGRLNRPISVPTSEGGGDGNQDGTVRALIIRLWSGSSGPYAENAWTARCFGPRPTWKRSCSISNIIITSIERMPDAKGSRRQRAMPIAHEQISVLIDGRSIVEAYTKRRLLHDLVIRHP